MFGARGEIRTHHKAGLKSAASSNWATRAKLFLEISTRERIRTSKTEGLSFRCLPIASREQMLVLPEGLEPSTTRLSTVRVCQLRHDSNEL